jgi:hypothetical protein
MKQKYSKSALTPTIKDIESEIQALHNDAFSKKHARDIVAALRKRLQAKGFDLKLVDSLCKEHLNEALASAGYPTSEPSIDLEGLEKIGDLRDNLCFKNGTWIQKSGRDWIDFFLQSKAEREVYKESCGSIRRPGFGRHTSPLKQLFFRLPPWIALELGKADEVMTKRTIIDLAEAFRNETGLEVLAVNIHRESAHDLHGHLIFSKVVRHDFEQVKTSAKEKRSFMALVREQIKKELKEQGLAHSPTDVKRTYEERGIVAPEYKSSDKYEYRKVRDYTFSYSNKSWPAAKRGLKTLGTSYRYKAMVYDAALNTDKETIRRFREPFPQTPGSFTSKYVSIEHPKEEYLDYWLETKYSELILARLSCERQKRIEAQKKQAIASYIKYGTSVVDPFEAQWREITTKAQRKQGEATELCKKLATQEQELKAQVEGVTTQKLELEQAKETLQAKLEEVRQVEHKAKLFDKLFPLLEKLVHKIDSTVTRLPKWLKRITHDIKSALKGNQEKLSDLDKDL